MGLIRYLVFRVTNDGKLLPIWKDQLNGNPVDPRCHG